MRAGPSRVAAAFLVALAIGEAGCAIIMQQPPRANRAPGEAPVCSTGRGGVALDGVLAALLGAGALAALASEEPGAALGIGAVGGLYAWSGLTGHRSASACEAAIEDYKIELAATRPPRPPAPTGPPIELAAPPEEEAAVAEQDPPAPPTDEQDPPAPPTDEQDPPAQPLRSSGRWSDFWVEVAK
ncbi:MAG TPA: hypothetical protein VIG06_13160 [Kofleriaceae bacterium]|jgi:hypothetical protein